MIILPCVWRYVPASLFLFSPSHSSSKKKKKKTLNARYLSFCEAICDDPTARTELHEQERQQMIAENPDHFLGSYIYSDADK